VVMLTTGGFLSAGTLTEGAQGLPLAVFRTFALVAPVRPIGAERTADPAIVRTHRNGFAGEVELGAHRRLLDQPIRMGASIELLCWKILNIDI